MYSIRTLTKGDFLYKDGNRVEVVDSPNLSPGYPTPPKFLVMHYTGAGSARGSINWFAQSNSKVSAHLVIERDGTVTQCVPFNHRAWHAGRSRWSARDGQTYSGLNSHSIGIELANAGPCRRTGSGRWVNGLGVTREDNQVVEAEHRNGAIWFAKRGSLPAQNIGQPGWEVYPEPQMTAARDVAAALVAHYGLDEVLGHDDISAPRKSDPGPLFDMTAFRGHVFGRAEDDDNLWAVKPGTVGGLSIRSGPAKTFDKVRAENLSPGTRVSFIEAEGRWWFVTVLAADGSDELDGWVHSAYLYDV